MVEYASIIAASAMSSLTGLIGFEPAWNVILIAGGFFLILLVLRIQILK